MTKDLVAVIIPIYQLEMTPAEQFSLRQGIATLAAYPIIIIKPQSLYIESISNEFTHIQSISFDDAYFVNVAGYNRLLTSAQFYKRFLNYQFILIYQLDALIFRDELVEWCNQNFDYVGAPKVPEQSKKAYFNTKKTLLNGGLSLRKVASCLRLTIWYRRFFGQWPGNEDMLFSMNATRLIIFRGLMNLPTWEQALPFAFEDEPQRCLELNHNQLPFGCHAWERYDKRFWENHIPILKKPRP